jgi:hypothetical protein
MKQNLRKCVAVFAICYTTLGGGGGHEPLLMHFLLWEWKCFAKQCDCFITKTYMFVYHFYRARGFCPFVRLQSIHFRY